jgi:hypothetical protein
MSDTTARAMSGLLANDIERHLQAGEWRYELNGTQLDWVVIALRALAVAPAQDGWRLVPEVPTEPMLLAAEAYNRAHITGEWSFGDCYRAMLGAAPAPVQGGWPPVPADQLIEIIRKVNCRPFDECQEGEACACRQIAEAILTAAPTAPQDGWRPISTAPKDGTRILILEDGRHHFLSAWGAFYSPFYRAEIAGWWTSSDPHRAHVTLPDEATHWQPLPAPPNGTLSNSESTK